MKQNTTSVRVFAPGTVANVACGFDVLGFALDHVGDEVEASIIDGSEVQVLEIAGDGGKLSRDPSLNTASVAAKSVLQKIGEKRGIALKIHKKMPLGSGLGSSAASAAAGAFAANLLFGSPLTRAELIPAAMEGERVACGSAHADNVAPSLLGGFVLIRSYTPLDVIEIAPPKDLHYAVVHPDLEIKTSDARTVLRTDLSLKDATTQWGNLAGLITGLLRSDLSLIGRSLVDVVVEPQRSILVPGFLRARESALKARALGFSLSGSGPSVFALTPSLESAKSVVAAVRNSFSIDGIESSGYVGAVNTNGAKRI